MWHIRRVLHATDFSSVSTPAFVAALQLARAPRARLLLLHVLEPPSPFLGDDLPGSYLELLATARRRAERRLADAVSRARKAGVRVEPQLVEGMAVDGILAAARRWRPDTIVIGTHGRSGLGRALMGSVAERVLSRAPCPVLTVRGRR